MDKNASVSPNFWSPDNRYEMPVFWNVIYLVESFLICFGNSISIVIFWRRRRSLKRTSCLLINLAVADLSLGVCTTAYTIAILSWPWNVAISYILMSISLLPTFASIFSLTLVSLETAYAMVFPFRHRTAGPHGYRLAVTLTWLLAASDCVPWILLPFFNFSFFLPAVYIRIVITGVCLVVMTSSYLLIWCSVSKRSRGQMRERAQRKKLAVTLFVVTVLSLLTWIPGQLAFVSHFFNELQFIHTGAILHAVLLSNSFLNPLVYTFRLPEFRDEIKLIICKLQCCRLEPRAAASSSPACNLVSMAIIDSSHEMRVFSSPCASQHRNESNTNELQFQGKNLNPGFINETGLQESARTVNK